MQTTMQITKTKDYDSFVYIHGNRDVEELKVRQLTESFKRNPNKIYVHVNNRNEIIDGQHRLEVAKRLKKWVYKINMGNVGLQTVQAVNSVNNAWKKTTFMKSYAKMGVESYVRFREFMENNKDFSLQPALSIFLNKSSADRSQHDKIIGRRRPFEEGQLEMPDLALAYENAGKIRLYKPYYSGYTRRSFVGVMLTLFRNKKFNNEVMLHKLSLQPTALTHCASIEQYKLLLEGIYNYKNSKKVNLRF